jgi:two-component system, NarL family, nitrate/nitrite response regulator NarL
MAARVYVCDQNPRMRQLLQERLHGHADVLGEGGTADEAIAAAAEIEPDLLVLDYRTAVGNIEGTVAAIKEASPATAVVIHTGVPRYLIQEQVEAAGGIYSPKNEPAHLIALARAIEASPTEAASRDS